MSESSFEDKLDLEGESRVDADTNPGTVDRQSQSIGVCQHFKGGLYLYLCAGSHSETGESLVCYFQLCDKDGSPHVDRKPYFRPRKMFFDRVMLNGTLVPRFTPVFSKLAIELGGLLLQGMNDEYQKRYSLIGIRNQLLWESHQD